MIELSSAVLWGGRFEIRGGLEPATGLFSETAADCPVEGHLQAVDDLCEIGRILAVETDVEGPDDLGHPPGAEGGQDPERTDELVLHRGLTIPLWRVYLNFAARCPAFPKQAGVARHPRK
jgi:hypothetical protein